MRARIVVLTAVVAAACAGSPRRISESGSSPGAGDLEGIDLVTFEVSPGGPPVDRYGARLDHGLIVAERRIADALGSLPLEHSPGLSRMARELAAVAPDRFNIPPALVDELMAWSGLVDPPPRIIVAELHADGPECVTKMESGCDEPIRSLVEQVGATLPEAAHLGYGVGVAKTARGNTRMIVAVLERAVAMDAVDRHLPSGGKVVVSGRLLGGRSQPGLEVIDPSGGWRRIPALIGDDNSFSARLACDRGDGAYQVEVLAEGPHGPEVAANFPLHCGIAPPQAVRVEVERLEPSVSAEQVARANFAYLNAERAQRGLPALEWDRRAAKVAEAHSRDMERNQFVGHRSPTTGDVAARFRKARLHGTMIRENVARGYGPKGIHDSLMRSPGHRVNVLAEDVTHVGIGIVIGRPETDVAGAPRPVYATQNFFRMPGAGAPVADGDLPVTLRQRIDARRLAAGIRPMRWDDRLFAVAQQQADAIARGRDPGMSKTLERAVAALGFRSIERHRVDANDYAAFVGLDFWGTDVGGAVGLGVARSRKGDEFVLVIVVAS